MLDILSSCWDLIAGLLAAVWGVIALVLVWGYEVLYHLHTSAPRLEGLLVGVLLAWLLMRREKHPVIRVLSAPLKLIIDILDLAWDAAVDVIADAWEAVTGVLMRGVDIVRSAAAKAYNWVLSKLTAARDVLRRKE